MEATAAGICDLARECGFDLAGIAAAVPVADFARYQAWTDAGMAGEMGYLTDRRAAIREDSRNLLPTARSVICLGKNYQTPYPYSTSFTQEECGWISRYAWGDDYHDLMRRGLAELDTALRRRLGPFDSKICVDTAPLLERSYARMSGLGWIGKNTCLINQRLGSWLFLGELLVSFLVAPDTPPPDRCGSCTRCIEACPTAALTPYTLDARRCISYFTIELRGPVPESFRPGIGSHIFGCDICQDVCPWNRRAGVTGESAFQPVRFAPPLARLAAVSEEEFRRMFRNSPIRRAKYSGFLRNIAIAMGNSGLPGFREPLTQLAANSDPVVAGAAHWALDRLR